ncbi:MULTISPECIES: MFS transporter [unclassified Acinetobacter]|uniref:MFS transporter n=1 Tax=unclassified Acinetobacter TaxID=196816 RepID=UPI0035BA6FA5
MSFQSNGYQFKPHEMPMMIGSPASPDHDKKRRIAYLLIGFYVSLMAGLQNGLLISALSQLRGDFALDLLQGGWIQVAYYMTYATASIFFFRVRQHFGIQKYVSWVLILLLVANGLQIVVHDYYVEIFARACAGLAASGLLVLGMFYIMQGLPAAAKIIGVSLALGLMQLGTPLAQMIVPDLLLNGNLQLLFYFSFALTAICVGLVWLLPIPPGQTQNVFRFSDWISLLLFATGIALLCAFLVQGRIVWWTTPWLGWLLAGSVICVGFALLFEAYRKDPILDVSWMSTPQILAFAMTGAVVRFLTSEQTVGAAGLMATLGMSGEQMTTFYTVVFFASLFGIIASIVRLDINDIRRPVVVALFGIALAAWLDSRVGLNTRPAQLYISQAIMAFSALYFLGPMMLEGLVRAIAKGPQHIMSFSAVFGLSQTIGGLAGAAIFSAFLTIRTRVHLADISQHFNLTHPQFAEYVQSLAKGYASQSSDIAVLQSKAVAQTVNQATTQATVLAYNDFFYLMSSMATIAFVITLLVWVYRRIYKIDIIAQEKQALFAMLKR